jgi:hypothetical protein
MSAPLRHRCRNKPHCGQRLRQPVDNDRRAFCSPGCHAGFYRKHCLVCEQPIGQPKGGGVRNLCKRAKCRSEYRRFPHVYDFPRAVAETPVKSANQPISALNPPPSPEFAKALQETPVKWAFKSGVRTGRGWRWGQFGDEHWLFDREEDVQARLIPDGELYIVRLTPGIDYGVPSPLDDAKRLAISLALARLPLEPKYAERLARINELPPDPPQNRVRWTASYLAGLAALKSDAPSIVPDLPYGDDLEIPAFLQRSTKEEVV